MMLPDPIELDLAHDRRERDIAEALRRRRSIEGSSVRRTIGRAVVDLGLRIAAEPPLRLARGR
jgi:hypothetical protein